ncbi:MAG: iron ABC transporter permease [Burkholderiales bacterium RIFCSPLOWO2_12_FULL_61_40]|nr:MAG: iron ABC transporter permease [Burkholderiales bacterium RIFCSPLOWO2_12_FULL_61_40]
MLLRLFFKFLLLLLALVLSLPVLSVLASWIRWDAASHQILVAMAQTVLPDYALSSLLLCMMVGLGVALVGGGAAAAVSLFDFHGRKTFEWALLLPLAVPAYVVAYAYTDFLQYSGPFQTGVRALTGTQGRVFPEVRNLGGAAWVFVFALYPYVYVLARAALAERATQLMEAARLLGAPLHRRLYAIALPLARPAIAAGVSLALMETLADYGVSSYFGIQTFTAGIYKAWLAMDNSLAAAQLATLLLLLVLLLLKTEQWAQRRLRFSNSKGGSGHHSGESQPVVLKGGAAVVAWALCSLPVLAGFVLPMAFMLRPLVADWSVLPWDSFLQWSIHSLTLALGTAALACSVAVLLAFAVRTHADRLTRGVVQIAALGYAIPGAVIVVGLLLPVGWLQAAFPQTSVGYWITATALGLVWAYLVRFCAVALQTIQSGYARIPASMDDSARMLGVTGAGLLVRVHWPLLHRSLAAACLLVLVDVMKELPATLVLRPFNSDTLAVVAYQLARDERLGEAALPSLALVLVGLIPVILLSRTLRSHPGQGTR